MSLLSREGEHTSEFSCLSASITVSVERSGSSEHVKRDTNLDMWYIEVVTTEALVATWEVCCEHDTGSVTSVAVYRLLLEIGQGERNVNIACL